GQIVLATNTASYNAGDGDIFLASFDGDCDTGKSKGNGAQIAYMPDKPQFRCIDTVDILGMLGTKVVAPIQKVDPAPVHNAVFGISGGAWETPDATSMAESDPCPNGPNPQNCPYYEGVTVTKGELRSEGVWVGGCGVSARDGTMKWGV